MPIGVQLIFDYLDEDSESEGTEIDDESFEDYESPERIFPVLSIGDDCIN